MEILLRFFKTIGFVGVLFFLPYYAGVLFAHIFKLDQMPAAFHYWTIGFICLAILFLICILIWQIYNLLKMEYQWKKQ